MSTIQPVLGKSVRFGTGLSTNTKVTIIDGDTQCTMYAPKSNDTFDKCHRIETEIIAGLDKGTLKFELEDPDVKLYGESMNGQARYLGEYHHGGHPDIRLENKKNLCIVPAKKTHAKGKEQLAKLRYGFSQDEILSIETKSGDSATFAFYSNGDKPIELRALNDRFVKQAKDMNNEALQQEIAAKQNKEEKLRKKALTLLNSIKI